MSKPQKKTKRERFTLALTISTNVHVDVLLKALVRPVFHSLQNELGRVGLSPPNVAELGLNGGQGDRFGQRVAGKDLDKRHPECCREQKIVVC